MFNKSGYLPGQNHVSLPTCDNLIKLRTMMKQLRESFDNVNSESVATGMYNVVAQKYSITSILSNVINIK